MCRVRRWATKEEKKKKKFPDGKGRCKNSKNVTLRHSRHPLIPMIFLCPSFDGKVGENAYTIKKLVSLVRWRFKPCVPPLLLPWVFMMVLFGVPT